ncbi:hypothetical protein Cde04nite_00470 [Cellulomonas denverensis]|nr:hypothetical protein Cde04nite_00470 [Cellulomonas denverensis]
MHRRPLGGGSHSIEDEGRGCTEKFPDDVRERAVLFVRDAKKDLVTLSTAGRRVGEQLGTNPQLLRAEPPLDRGPFTPHERPCTPR